MKCMFLRVNTSILAMSVMVTAMPAMAQNSDDGSELGELIVISDDVSFDISAATRLRYEISAQDNAVGNAAALTFRARLGGELEVSGFKFLVEAEGTGAVIDDYNDTIPSNGLEPFSVVADPENIELNRLQASYIENGNGITIGRQRIIYDNARFVGNVGWRQNEQTFDAIRGQLKTGNFSANAAFAISQRTIFGDNSPNAYFDGDMTLLNGKFDLEKVDISAFAYLIDYDTRLAFSSETYGLLAKGALLVGKMKVNMTGSYAKQSDYGSNPVSYSADYLNLELGGTFGPATLTLGYEELGSDDGVAAFQTPLATLHAFNGWADLFLTTPAGGLRDYYVKAYAKLDVPALKMVAVTVLYHDFESDFGDLTYGREWDASLGFKLGTVGMALKYANYSAEGFGVNTEKLWMQAQWVF